MRCLPRLLVASMVLLASGCGGGGGGGIGEVTLSASSSEIFQTETVPLTLTVEKAPGRDLPVTMQSSNPSILDVPMTVTIPAGSTSTTFVGTGILAGGPVLVTARIGEDPNVSITVLEPPEITLVAVTTSADQMSSGTLVWTGTATHARALDPANVVVETLEAGLTLGAATLTGNASAFTVEVPYLLDVDALPGPATISVDTNGDVVGADDTVEVAVQRIPRLASITPATATLDTTELRTFTATLDQPARNGGETIALAVSDDTKLTVPSMVVVSAGVFATSITVTAVTTGGPVTLSGTLADSTRQSSVTIANAVVFPLVFTGNDAFQGASTTVMVTGTGSSYVAIDTASFTLMPAAMGGLTISNAQLSGTHASWSLSFDVSVDAAAPVGVQQIVFDANGSTPGGAANLPFTVRELPRVLTVGPDGTRLDTGASATMTVVLTEPARTGGESVMLSSTSGAISFSSPVTVLAGTSSATFSVTGAVEGSADLVAALNGGADSTRIDVVFAQQGSVVVTEILSLGTNGEAIEIHNTTGAPISVNGWFVQTGTGALESIRAAGTPTDIATAVTVTAGGIAWGVPNPSNAAAIPAGAAFVYGAPGTTTSIADSGDRLRLFSATTVLQDEVDMRGMFVAEGATTLGASDFPGHPGRTTQLRSTVAGGATMKDDNDDGGNWCVTFRAKHTLGAANQACSEVVINEVFYDPTGANTNGDVFVELAAGGGTFIGGGRVRPFDQAGMPITASTVTFTTGTRVPVDGLYVVADATSTSSTTTNVPNADQVANFHPQVGAGDGIQLQDASLAVLDVVQYGAGGTAMLTDGTAAVEGTFAVDAPEASSIARAAFSTDTNDNATDFVADSTPSAGTPNGYSHTITIDGVNDFTTAAERFATTSAGFDGYFAWDDAYLYFGMSGSDVSANDPFKWVHAYFSGDAGSPTTTVGQTYNTQQATLAFGAAWHFRWRTDNTFVSIQRWDGMSWVESGISLAGNVFQSGTFVEMRVPRATLFGSSRIVHAHLAMVNETAFAEGTFAGVPSTSFTDGYDPNFSRYLELDLESPLRPTASATKP